MLSNSQTTTLKKILSKQKGSLQSVQQEYLNNFTEAMSLFNAASFLSQLLQTHKLQLEQRMISLYLVLVSYCQCSPENNPFVMNILEVSDMAQNNFDRIMIYEILIRKNKNKFSTQLIEDIAAQIQKQKQLSDEEKEIRKLRTAVFQKYKNFQFNMPINSMRDSVPEFLRLPPEYISISTSELNWLSPGIISDVEWDNSAEVDKKLQKSRQIFENALKRTLQQQERTELLNSIESDPYSALHIGFSVKDLHKLITHNSYIAASLVIKLSKYPVFEEYLQQFLHLPTTANLIDATARIIKQVRVPQLYVQIFCSHHMDKLVKYKAKETAEVNVGIAHIMSAFLECMIQNQILDPLSIPNLKNFIDQFCNVINFGPLKALIDQQSKQIIRK